MESDAESDAELDSDEDEDEEESEADEDEDDDEEAVSVGATDGGTTTSAGSGSVYTTHTQNTLLRAHLHNKLALNKNHTTHGMFSITQTSVYTIYIYRAHN